MEDLNRLFEAMIAAIEAADAQDFGFPTGNLIDWWAKIIKAYCDLERKPELWERCRPRLLRFRESLFESVRRESPNEFSVLYIDSVKRPSLDTLAQLADDRMSGTGTTLRRLLQNVLTAYLAKEQQRESPARYGAIQGIRDVLSECGDIEDNSSGVKICSELATPPIWSVTARDMDEESDPAD